MPSSARRQEQLIHASEPSAYRATTHRLGTGSTSSASSRAHGGIPSILTTIDTNKPLPLSPNKSERKMRKPAYLRSLLGRSASSHLDPTHLQPQPYVSNNRYSSTGNTLSLGTHHAYHHAHSRSMPSSPHIYGQAATLPQPGAPPRVNSAAAHYPESTEYEPYIPPWQQSSEATHFVRPPRSSSMNAYSDTTPPRAHTFPAESSVASPTMREGLPNRPRPHTWLSPTESFSDASQYSLFVQATTGLLEDSDPFSPTGPPQLQGSLFARRGGKDIIPLPFQGSPSNPPRATNLRTDWQNYEPPPFTFQAAAGHSSNLPRPLSTQQLQELSHVAVVNRELELLGLEDDDERDEELPNYAQSQAEAHARRRAEASARAKELEARWRNTRSR
ncbi:hypothetical protein BDU57DRAFT_447085 [Ampelomyces quisqualis]|uniref:Uncharacterized protein n=1 Tax=Ampelomyces quisqualis TaxID=50730 RepID=A0A6A5QU80_AMPQU|nr:hypothetical protein BDU57DRAFT_447085 [Ampelomyces quisqualis]